MRNLVNINYRRAPLPLENNPSPSATAWDTSTNSVIAAFGPTPETPVIELKRFRFDVLGQSGDSLAEAITSWDAPCPLPDLACDEILCLQYFPDTTTACLVLAGGDLVLVREKPLQGEDRIEIVGSVEVGIAAATWSPDEELLAIVTRSETFLFMTREFESVNEDNFSANDVNASKHVSVGWGKKETQFQGKRAKALRDPTMPETVDEGKLSKFDDRKTTISWRGDGAYVAVNSIVSNERRMIRIFSREGVLDSASEPVDGLEGALSWRPAGNIIAGVQRRDTSVDVVFFERNGLRHGQFSLRLSEEDASTWASQIKLAWNIDSTVLAIEYQDRIQLWTMGNYHYYLKQEIPLGTNIRLGHSLRWHPEQPLRLCLSEKHSITMLEYVFDLTGGSAVQPFDSGAMAVIDGKVLKLTPLKISGVPPPMSLFEVTIEDPIISIAFSQDCSIIAVLTHHCTYLYTWDLKALPVSPPERIQAIPCNHGEESKVFRQICFGVATELFIAYVFESGTHAVMRLVQDQNKSWSTASIDSQSDDNLMRLVTDIQHESSWAQYPDHLQRIDAGIEREIPVQIASARDYSWLSIASTRLERSPDGINGYGPSDGDSNVMTVGLTRTGELFANSRSLAKNCTSFLLTPTHLLFTTAQHLLKFVHMAPAEELEIPADTPEVDERCRAIERGAKLVTVTPSNYAVTLQMPRGNLETIYPRALVLNGIRQHVDGKDYKAAYLACRNHQVDTNILCDYQPEQFMSNVGLVIKQWKKPSRIDDFLAKLRDEDVSMSMYRDTLKLSESTRIPGNIATPIQTNQPTRKGAQAAVVGKTNRICDAFLALFNENPSSHVQNTITAHVSKRPPDLMAGLQLVSKLRGVSIEEADAAMVHLCFLSDVNRLYDVALSLYDIPLTLLVAEQSQKDPREYMPFLEHLHAIPQDFRRRFEIDDYLHNHPKALSALWELGAHDELEKYCIKHSLYGQALALYKYESSPQRHFQAISRLFAEHLVSNSKNRQAAILYESLQDYTSAYPLYALAHMWRESLTCALFVGLSSEQSRSHAMSLANTLAEEDRDYRAAAAIHGDHLNDFSTAARLLCKGSYFGDATRILALHGLGDQIPLIVDTGLTEKFGEILELLADCKSQFSAQVPRIEELRVKKAEDPLAFFGGEANAETGAAGDVPDNVSIAPTNASTVGGQSLFTRYGSSKGAGTVMTSATRKTSKTKRKEERKRAMGKKGSVYEEEYLIGSVYRCMERVNGAVDEMRRLGEGLLRRSMRNRAEVLEETVKEILQLSRDSAARVWIRDTGADAEAENNDYDLTGEGRPNGADGILWDSQQGTTRPARDPPNVKEWKPLEG